jgi:hypothetical protein
MARPARAGATEKAARAGAAARAAAETEGFNETFRRTLAELRYFFFSCSTSSSHLSIAPEAWRV